MRTIFTALIFLAALPLGAQGVGDTSMDDFKNWTKTIGSDEFGGRKPMTRYETKTIEYLAGEFKALGLEPAFDGSYYQIVKELSTTVSLPSRGIHVRAEKGTIRLTCPEDVIVWTTRGEEKIKFENAEYVFCGFGIDAPEYGWNDYEGLDVKGKIVLAMVNDPGFYDDTLFRGKNMTFYGRWRTKMEQAQKLGAVGCLIIHNEAAAGYGWHVCVNGRMGSNITLFNEETGNKDELGMRGWVTEDACRRIFEKSGVDFEKALEMAKKPGFKAVPLHAKSSFSMGVKCELGESCNVGGLLPGTDLKDECVVFSAHWDHFGIDKPDETGDAIYNGASDNGSGLAAIMVIAKKLKSMQPLRRSILFLAPTSEESGLLGSKYYCNHPVFPMEKTVACLNFDCLAPEPLTRDFVYIDGGGHALDKYIRAAAADQGRYAVAFNDDTAGRFFRSDHWNFARRGVPAIVIQRGRDLVNPDKPNKYPIASWYHKPNDEYRDDWELEGCMSNINLILSVGLSVANADTVARHFESKRIFLAAASTCCNYDESRRPQYGWGEKLGDYFPGSLVFNHAKGGRSTKSFIDEGRWDAMIAEVRAGDIVIVSFGHNDEKKKDPRRYTEPYGEYYENLCRFVKDIKKKRAVPVVMSPLSRRHFKKDGTVSHSHGKYPLAAKKAADDTGACFIDLEGLSYDWLVNLGPEESKECYLWYGEKKDNTHLCERGAREIARIVAKELRLHKILH